MYVKKSTNKVLPTVVYPELYRKRFCEAMERYFTVVPDKWTGLEAGVDFFLRIEVLLVTPCTMHLYG